MVPPLLKKKKNYVYVLENRIKSVSRILSNSICVNKKQIHFEILHWQGSPININNNNTLGRRLENWRLFWHSIIVIKILILGLVYLLRDAFNELGNR